MRSSRTRTNVGITTRKMGEEQERPNSRKLQQGHSNPNEFVRTSLPMFNSRGGQGDKKSEQDKWQFQSHDKTLAPTERISRQTGELSWKAAPPQVYHRPMDSSLQRANATVFNMNAYDKDQDGKLDETELFHSTSAGKVGKAKETHNAREYLLASKSNNKDDMKSNDETQHKNNISTSRNKTNKTLNEKKTFEENVDHIAKQRALIGEILHRNQSHLELFTINPGQRKQEQENKQTSWQECENGPDPSTHFTTNDSSSIQIDRAMDAVYDEKTYDGNFPLYIRDMYQNESRAKLVGSSNMKNIFSPLRSDGGKSALNPPPSSSNNKKANNNIISETSDVSNNNGVNDGVFDLTQVSQMQGVSERSSTVSRRPDTAPNLLTKTSPVQTFGSVHGSTFTSAFRQANYYESDIGESYEGQWQKSKTLGFTSRGVRQKGEHHCLAGGLGNPSGASIREGRLTITRKEGQSRPYTTSGISTNLDLSSNNCSTNSQTSSSSKSVPKDHFKERHYNVRPKGRWTNPDRGRQLPITLFDDKLKDGDIKPSYFVPTVYSRDLSDEHLKNDSMSAWRGKAKSHESAAWKRPPNTLFTGVVYNATIPRTSGVF